MKNAITRYRQNINSVILPSLDLVFFLSQKAFVLCEEARVINALPLHYTASKLLSIAPICLQSMFLHLQGFVYPSTNLALTLRWAIPSPQLYCPLSATCTSDETSHIFSSTVLVSKRSNMQLPHLVESCLINRHIY